jgi:hypothetical protein
MCYYTLLCLYWLSMVKAGYSTALRENKDICTYAKVDSNKQIAQRRSSNDPGRKFRVQPFEYGAAFASHVI